MPTIDLGSVVGPKGERGETGPTGATGKTGATGTTFTPSVSSDGILSWSNDGSKTNPASVDIAGAAKDRIPNATQSAAGLMSADDKKKLDGAAPLASPAFTGSPTAPNAEFGDKSTKIATSQFVADNAVPMYGLGENLLINADFRKPVNRNGQSSYVGEVQGLDCWNQKNSGDGVVTINDGSITLYRSNNNFAYINQMVDVRGFKGQTATISVLGTYMQIMAFSADDPNVYVWDAGSIGNSGLPASYFTLRQATFKIPDNKNALNIQITGKPDVNVDVLAAKLELGTQQTLAHQDSSGNWVLNAPVDYDKEYLRCLPYSQTTGQFVGVDLIENNAGAHNSIYRGKYLGSAVTAAQYAMINAGTFDDIFIGDYWTINGVNWRVAALDYYLHYGDTECTKHHVVVVPDTCLVNAKMNSTNIVTGAYVGSDYYTGANGNTAREDAGNIIKAAFGSDHILAHRIVLQNTVPEGKGYTGVWGAWYDAHPADLMSEEMVYGCKEFKNEVAGENIAGNYTVDHGQLPLFRHDHSRICNRANWWLREVANPTIFSHVTAHGYCNCNNASYTLGVRPASAICA